MSIPQFETLTLENIRFHRLQSDKFKTTSLAVLIQQELSEEKVTKTALLPHVLQRGTERYPTTLGFQRRLDELYGARLFCDVFKRGERHMIQFVITLANETYLREKPSLLKEGIAFLGEVLFSPVLEQGVFKADYVEAEKTNLRQRIKSLQDDKIRYAAKRLTEEMCKDEPYALHAYGRQSDLEIIDSSTLYTYYQKVLQNCPVDVYVVGEVDLDEVTEQIQQQLLSQLPAGVRQVVDSSSNKLVKQREKVVVDELDVKQGKLNIGCRTHTTIDDEAYPALLLYNGILGGFAHSKLFMNVREKASLAYYCSSRLESHKGLLSIQSGIEIHNYDKALSIIKEQLNEMREGKISDQELEKTKATIINQFRERLDSAYGMIDLHHHSSLSKRKWPLPELLEQIAQTTREEVQQVAEKITIDTIYFLRDQGGQDDAKN